MRLAPLSLAIAALLVAALPAPAAAQVSAGVVLDRDGLRHFHLAIGAHYGVPHQRVAQYYGPHVYHDEIPVVLFLARQAGVSPEAVIALRERGWAWIDVALHLGIRPTVFVAHLPVRRGPPYGNAHGYWRKREARYLTRLTDREIVDFVNLHFISTHYRRPVQEVVVLRDRGASFIQIQASFERGRTAVRSSGHSAPAVRSPAPPVRSAGPPARSAGPPVRSAGPPGRGPGGAGPPGQRGRGGPPGHRGGGG